MISQEKFNRLLPFVCDWAEEQERYIVNNGVPLTDDQQIDAYLIGVKEIKNVRLLKVNSIPVPSHPELNTVVKETGIITPNTIGITFRYGIYIRSDFWSKRSLVVHELVHTMQYEKLGGIESFLKTYISECLKYGYPNGPLEQEALVMEKKITM